jgi:hypothetical protein
MKQKIFALLVILLFGIQAQGSLYILEKAHTFGFISDTSYNAITCPITAEDTFPLNQYTMLISKLPEYKETPKDKDIPYICNRYRFTDFPCIKLYRLNCAEAIGFDNPEFLFNKCDSSLCLSDGDVSRFSRVMRQYLPQIITQNRVLELLYLYFNILSTNEEYVILNKPSDYTSLWDKYRGSLLNNGEDSLSEIMIRNDIDAVMHHNFSTNITKEDSIIEANLWTWGNKSGQVTKWDFQISNSEIKLLDKTIMVEKMRPSMIKTLGRTR